MAHWIGLISLIGGLGTANAPAIAQSNSTPLQNQKQVRTPDVLPLGIPDANPLPELLRNPATTIELRSGLVDITLLNDTNTEIIYQVLGDTEPRSLPAGETVLLLELSAPVQMTFNRSDNGFLDASLASAGTGLLQVTLDEIAEFASSEAGLIVEESGNVIVD
jgi:hypothetical protein